MGRNRRSLIDLLPRAGFALAAAVLFAPAAHADCTTHLPNLTGGGLPFTPLPSASHPAPMRPPCSGPHCGRHAPVPASPAPAPPRSGGGEEWGCIAAGDPFLSPSFGRPHCDDAPGRPVRRAAAVFHPPRLSSLSA